MPYNGSGSFSPYTPGNPVVTGTTISSTAFNNTVNDIAAGLSNAVTRDGQSPATANLPMGNNKITGLANATNNGEAVAYGQTVQLGSVTATGNLSASGNLTFTGTGNRITGDFSNATASNRVLFQSSTANGNTLVNAIPNGTAVVSQLGSFNSSDPSNSSFFNLICNATEARLTSGSAGTGTLLPMTFYTSGTEKFRIAADTTGTYTFGGTAPRITGDFSNATFASRVSFQTSTANANTAIQILPNGTATTAQIIALNNSDPTNASTAQFAALSTETRIISGATGTGTLLPMTFYTGGVEAMRIDASRNITMRATGSTATTHSFVYNENGGEIQLHNNAGTVGTQIDISSGSTRVLHSLSTGDVQFGIAAGNTTGNVLITGANNTERLRVGPSGQLGIGGANYGTAGQVLVSLGPSSPPQWASSQSIGIGQTWQSVTRLSGTQYTNSTGRPILVSCSWTQNSGANVVVDGVTIASVSTSNLSTAFSFIVPSGSNYTITAGSGLTVTELR